MLDVDCLACFDTLMTTTIPSDAKYWRKHEHYERRDFLQALGGWIADDVADGRTPPEGLVWVYRAARRLNNVADLLSRAEGVAWATEHGVIPGARVRIVGRYGSDDAEGVVQAVNGWWATLDTAPQVLLIGCKVEAVGNYSMLAVSNV